MWEMVREYSKSIIVYNNIAKKLRIQAEGINILDLLEVNPSPPPTHTTRPDNPHLTLAFLLLIFYKLTTAYIITFIG